MKLRITNISKILQNDTKFNWINVVPMSDRYTFYIESKITQYTYYLDLYRFSEHQTGTYPLMFNNLKYRNDKRWVTLNDIRNICVFKEICVDMICDIEIPY
jgi:hypothetical protein